MSLFDKFDPLAQLRSDLQVNAAQPFGAETEQLFSATEGTVNGRRVILAGTNNYLGLSLDPDCIAAAQQALAEQGTGTTGSRMASGTFSSHLALERELAVFFGKRQAMIFSTGYAATMGMGSTLAGPGDVILLDADSHASIYDGVRLGGAEVIRFKHNDAADLEKRMRRLGQRAANALIIVEGIYSMLGDQAPLAAIVDVKRRYGGYLMVDEAHSLGITGANGRGMAEQADVEADVDFIVGTFSKSLGSIGGYCVSNHAELESIRYAVRSYIFTASSSPAVIAATRAALKIIRQRPSLRAQLWENANRLYNGLKHLGMRLGPEVGPVIAAIFEHRQAAIDSWKQLLDSGVCVNLVVPPASPNSHSLLRCSVSAAHSPAQIEQIIAAYAALPCNAYPLAN